MSSIIKRLRSALRIGGCEFKEVRLNNAANTYITMDISLWIPAKDLGQAQKLLKELSEEFNGKRIK